MNSDYNAPLYFYNRFLSKNLLHLVLTEDNNCLFCLLQKKICKPTHKGVVQVKKCYLWSM